MAHFMAHIEIPIRLNLQRIPIAWEIRTVRGDSRHKGREYAFPTLLADTGRARHLDAWDCRDDLFSLREKDNKALLAFLAKVGMFMRQEGEPLGHWSGEVMKHYREEQLMPLDVDGLWKFQQSLKSALTNMEGFKKTYAPLLNDAEDGLEFPLRLELTKVAAGVLTLDNAYHALLASVFFDIARGLRFRVCALPDCDTPFPLGTRTEKIFCTQYHAHLASKRRNYVPKGRTKTSGGIGKK
jgi:hypothetical protein